VLPVCHPDLVGSLLQIFSSSNSRSRGRPMEARRLGSSRGQHQYPTPLPQRYLHLLPPQAPSPQPGDLSATHLAHTAPSTPHLPALWSSRTKRKKPDRGSQQAEAALSQALGTAGPVAVRATAAAGAAAPAEGMRAAEAGAGAGGHLRGGSRIRAANALLHTTGLDTGGCHRLALASNPPANQSHHPGEVTALAPVMQYTVMCSISILL
jgi:hypothetical protein